MKTVIISNFGTANNYIKDALSDLQPCQVENHTWYKGKFYTKELYLIELDERNHNLDELLDVLVIDGRITNVISIGLASPLPGHIRPGDVLINDFPKGSCQNLLDAFLDQPGEEEEEPLRIFAGTIISQVDEENSNGGSLTCLDPSCARLISLMTNKGLAVLAVRILTPEADENNLDVEIMANVVQKLLALIKKSLERA
ncbi:MAG: hypothetical protein ACOWWO_11135 [Peptococcaceae bacterium]